MPFQTRSIQHSLFPLEPTPKFKEFDLITAVHALHQNKEISDTDDLFRKQLNELNECKKINTLQ